MPHLPPLPPLQETQQQRQRHQGRSPQHTPGSWAGNEKQQWEFHGDLNWKSPVPVLGLVFLRKKKAHQRYSQ